MLSETRTEETLSGRSLAGGRYHLLELIGSGAFGVVYRARHVALDRDVAIKILYQDVAEAHQAVSARFKREAQAASRLQHPNVVQVMDFGEENGLLFLAMEFLEGRSLRHLLNEDGPLSLGTLVGLLVQVCGALAAAHDQGTVHRDIKPENIVVLARRLDDGSHGHLVKVLDFGIAKVRVKDKEGAQASLTGQGEIFGTPEYMSPEQARGAPLDARSDLYAVGIMLYEAVCGRTPFGDSETPVGLLVRQLTEPPAPPSQLVPDIPEPLEKLILKALEKDPSNRHQSARELRSELLALLRDPAINAWDSGVAAAIPFADTSISQPPRLESQQRSTLAAIGGPMLPDDDVVDAPTRATTARNVIFAVVAVVAALVAFLVVGSQPEAPAPTAEQQVEPVSPVVPAPPAEPTPTAAAPSTASPTTQPASPSEHAPPAVLQAAAAPVIGKSLAAAIAVAVSRVAAVGRSPNPSDPQPVVTAPLEADGAQRRASRRRSRQDAADAPGDPQTAEKEAASDTVASVPVALVASASADAASPPPDPVQVSPPDEGPRRESRPAEPAEPRAPPSLEAAVSVDGLVVKGSLPRGVVERAVESQTSDIEACYHVAAREAGRDESVVLKVGFEINVDGWAGNIKVSSARLPGLSGCVSNVLAGIRLRDRPDTGIVLAAGKLTFTPR